MPMKMMMALNAYENSGSKMPMKIMALNVYANGSFERLYKLWV